MAVIDRTTPEGRKFYAELKKLAELESYAGFQGGVETAKKREGDQIVDTDVDLPSTSWAQIPPRAVPSFGRASTTTTRRLKPS